MDTKDRLVMIGERIRDVRERAGLSVEALAQTVGCSASDIEQVEEAFSDPPISVLADIAKALGVPLQALVSDERVHMFPIASFDLVGPIFRRALAEAAELLEPEERQRLATQAETFSHDLQEAVKPNG